MIGFFRRSSDSASIADIVRSTSSDPTTAGCRAGRRYSIGGPIKSSLRCQPWAVCRQVSGFASAAVEGLAATEANQADRKRPMAIRRIRTIDCTRGQRSSGGALDAIRRPSRSCAVRTVASCYCGKDLRASHVDELLAHVAIRQRAFAARDAIGQHDAFG